MPTLGDIARMNLGLDPKHLKPEVITDKQKEYYKKLQEENKIHFINSEQAFKQLKSIMLKFAKEKEFKYNPINEEVMWLVAFYITRNDNFFRSKHLLQGQKLSLKKGLLFIGYNGVGKSIIMDAARKIRNVANPLPAYMDSVHQMTFEYEAIKKLPERFYQKKMIIDDFGAEKKSYGEKLSGKVIELRYFKKLKTSATTNMDLFEIKETYGMNCYDRVKEMFNIVVFENEKSLR